jgi:hypothetical protein
MRHIKRNKVRVRGALGNRVDDLNYRIENAQRDIAALSSKVLRELHALKAATFEQKCKALTWVPHVFVSPVAMAAIEMLIDNEIKARKAKRASGDAASVKMPRRKGTTMYKGIRTTGSAARVLAAP